MQLSCRRQLFHFQPKPHLSLFEDFNVPAGDQLDHWEAEDRRGWAGHPPPLPTPDSPTLSAARTGHVQSASESGGDIARVRIWGGFPTFGHPRLNSSQGIHPPPMALRPCFSPWLDTRNVRTFKKPHNFIYFVSFRNKLTCKMLQKQTENSSILNFPKSLYIFFKPGN